MRLLVSLFTRAIGAVAVIVLVLIVGRQYESDEAGLILFLFASAQFLMGLSRGGTEVDLLEAARNRFMADGFAQFRIVAARSVRRSIAISIPVAAVAFAAFMTSERSDGFLLTVGLFAISIVPGGLILLELEVLRGIGNAPAATLLQTGAMQLVLLPVAWFGVGGATGFALSFAMVHVAVFGVVGWALMKTLAAQERQVESDPADNLGAVDLVRLQERRRGWVISVELLRIAFVWLPLLALYWKGTANAILEFSVAGRMAAAVGVLVPAFLNFLAPTQVAKYVDGSQIPRRTLLFGLAALLLPAAVLGLAVTVAPGEILQISGLVSLSSTEFLRLLLALIGMNIFMGLASFYLQERLIGRFERPSAISLAIALVAMTVIGSAFVQEFDSVAAARIGALLQGAALLALAIPHVISTRSYAK